MEKRLKDLELIIDKQKEELVRYKKRLADVVTAYKCLTKEKEVLETSLKALHQANSVASDSQDDSGDPSDDQSQDSPRNEDPEQLKTQLNTLMNSLATLSEEKSRMEASFQADKKALRAEKQQLENNVKELEERLEHETRSHLSEMENFKSKLIIERHQREKEHNDHGVMIRELQKVVSEERGRREVAERDAEGWRVRASEALERVSASERGTAEARSRLQETSALLEEARRGSGDQAATLLAQLAAVKTQLSITTSQEQARAAEAEERARTLAEIHEERVANLEARLAELSQTVGNYDRLRQADQQSIDKLKERLVQIELEHGEEKGDLSVDNLLTRLARIRELLELANLAAEKPIDIKSLILETFQINSIEDSHEPCKAEYLFLKKEFESYKQKQSFSITSNSRVDTKNDFNHQESKIKLLKDKVSALLEQKDKLENSYKREIDSLKQILLNERMKFKEKLDTCEKKCLEEVKVLEDQLSRQRERALALVKQKEEEITELKETFSNIFPQRLSLSEKEESSGVVSGGMLHFSQEVARRDVELSRLRRDNHTLESQLRQNSLKLEDARRKEIELITALSQQSDRLKRCQSQDGANLEYLKNVVFNFLVSDDSSCKSHMLNAIATVLKFTDTERNDIKQRSWWFNKVL